MKVRATVSFSGQVCAARGEVVDLPDGDSVLEDLLQAGYVENAGEGVSAGEAKRADGGRGKAPRKGGAE